MEGTTCFNHDGGGGGGGGGAKQVSEVGLTWGTSKRL